MIFFTTPSWKRVTACPATIVALSQVMWKDCARVVVVGGAWKGHDKTETQQPQECEERGWLEIIGLNKWHK